jgi:ABC-2 type transport system ATP-binding protein
MNSIIAVENLSKVYKKNFKTIHALKNITFTVPKNRILGILGPNGAGKTTLLKILTGIIEPSQGSGNVNMLGTEDIKSIKHQIGFLPENLEFFKNTSAYELLEFSLKISGTPFHPERIDELLTQVSLFDERKERVKFFSKGMRQRLGIAQAIIHNPKLLILDEPMSGLDPQGRRMVIDIITHYFKEGKTILFSTHNLDDIEALCTDVMVLKNGEIRLEKSLSQLREQSTYRIEVEQDSLKGLYLAANASQLWDYLERARAAHMRLIKVQSDITQQLENLYESK